VLSLVPSNFLVPRLFCGVDSIFTNSKFACRSLKKATQLSVHAVRQEYFKVVVSTGVTWSVEKTWLASGE